jgi:uncharacterized protein
MPLSFEWDQAKAKFNLSKHGVSFEEASTVFGDPLSLTIADAANSQLEDRWIGFSAESSSRISAGNCPCATAVHDAQRKSSAVIE